HARMGDFATAMHIPTKKVVHCICGDIGPNDEIGEGSMRLVKDLGGVSDPRDKRAGWDDRCILVVVWEGTRLGPNVIPTVEQIDQVAAPLWASISPESLQEQLAA